MGGWSSEPSRLRMAGYPARHVRRLLRQSLLQRNYGFLPTQEQSCAGLGRFSCMFFWLPEIGELVPPRGSGNRLRRNSATVVKLDLRETPGRSTVRTWIRKLRIIDRAKKHLNAAASSATASRTSPLLGDASVLAGHLIEQVNISTFARSPWLTHAEAWVRIPPSFP
jgi:hypothetical protein